MDGRLGSGVNLVPLGLRVNRILRGRGDDGVGRRWRGRPRGGHAELRQVFCLLTDWDDWLVGIGVE